MSESTDRWSEVNDPTKVIAARLDVVESRLIEIHDLLREMHTTQLSVSEACARQQRRDSHIQKLTLPNFDTPMCDGDTESQSLRRANRAIRLRTCIPFSNHLSSKIP